MYSALYYGQVLIKLDFSRYIFEKILKTSDFAKIRLQRAELFHADGRTDMKKPTVAFPSFANTPTN